MASEFNILLKDYYNKHFPYQLIYNWLNYKDGKNCFNFREFSFTLPGDIYVRYQAFDNAIDLCGALQTRIPLKIDVGAVYNMSPRLCRSFPNDFRPIYHELVFDIDISDYDDVRNCCKESQICEKCWPFMRIGAKILHSVLTHEFGFKHLLFVFSGRRGFHCWVCDKEARELTTDARKAIVDYFTVVVGGQSVVKRVSITTPGVHPMLTKALKVIENEFDELMVKKQDFLGSEQLVQNIIDLVGEDPALRQILFNRCQTRKMTSAECWQLIKLESSKYKGKRSRYFIQEIMLQHCFPRLDANVTRGLNHLIKLPFCIHPKTGNVCVPINIENIDDFDISSVINIKNLSRESMQPYIKIFKNFIDNLNQ